MGAEIYLPHAEALKVCQSFNHLIGSQFKYTENGFIYDVITINPVPVNEIDEFREILTTFIQTQGANKIDLDLFEARVRDDNFTVVLSSSTNLRMGVSLLSVSLRQYVQADVSLKYGFPVDDDLVLF